MNIHPEYEEAYLSDIRANSDLNLDLLKEIAHNTKLAAESSVEILELLKTVREDI